jgi:retron-type reverse transcriptase
MQHPPRPKPKAPSLNLEMAQFAPLTGDELKKQARGLGSRFGSPWFGRRDVIPPASDERTRIIDRGMVGAGLLTPEELVELHKIGDEMARLKPDLAQAATQAQQAVAQDKEARAALKKKKKEEAAERKRLHAEGVAKRKATDIIFLGRGVSKGLADRRANVEKLQAAKLPVLAQPSAIAQALELPIKRLRWLCFHSEAATRTHYIRFTVPKKNGGTRELAAPHRDLARCQQWILKNILEKVPTHSAAHGFIPKRSTLTNAKAHVGQAAVLNLDLKDFFPTIRFHRVRGIFNKMGYSPAAATILGLLCTESPRRVVQYAGKTYHVATGPRGLPQGACTSPALSNLAARKLDARLEGISTKLGWTYTRYADDMTFSGNPEAAKKSGYLLARIRHIAENERFEVNEEKTRIQRVDTAQLVTGIVVNTRPGVPRKLARRLRAILHRAKKEGLAAQNRQNRPHFEAWLQGMISYVAMVNPAQAQPLQTAFDALK